MPLHLQRDFPDEGPLLFDCPCCGTEAVNGTIRLERATLFVLAWRVTQSDEIYVTCGNCEEELRIVRVKIEDVPRTDPQALATLLWPPTTRKGRILAFAAFITCIIPIVGLIVSWWALRTNHEHHGVSRLVSMVTIVFSVISVMPVPIVLIGLGIKLLMG